jgi:hypothetical protein
MMKVQGRSPDRRESQVIELRLMQAGDMFEMPHTDLFSEYRNFLTGVDFCLSELRGRRSRRPVRLDIQMPPEEIDDGVAERLARTLRRYCNHRIRYNQREGRAERVGGVSALRIGVPVSAVGLVLTVVATGIRPTGGAANLVTDHLGWVLAWIGLWFPLDAFLFYPLAYGRESRVLRLLACAEVDVRPYRPALGTHADQDLREGTRQAGRRYRPPGRLYQGAV